MAEQGLRSHAVLRNPTGKFDVCVAQDWQVSLGGRICGIPMEERVVLDGLIRNTNTIVTTGDLWSTVREDMPKPGLDIVSAKDMVNKKVRKLKTNPLVPEVSGHIVRLGTAITSVVLFLDDITTPDRGVEIINSTANPKFLERYLQDFGQVFGAPKPPKIEKPPARRHYRSSDRRRAPDTSVIQDPQLESFKYFNSVGGMREFVIEVVRNANPGVPLNPETVGGYLRVKGLPKHIKDNVLQGVLGQLERAGYITRAGSGLFARTNKSNRGE